MAIHIVTRHLDGALELAKREALKLGECNPKVHLNDVFIDGLKPGDRVYGTLPLHLIEEIQSKGARPFGFVKGPGRLQDGKSYSLDELVAHGAHYREVHITFGPGDGSWLRRIRDSASSAKVRLGNGIRRLIETITRPSVTKRLIALTGFAIFVGLTTDILASIIGDMVTPQSEPVFYGMRFLVAFICFILALFIGFRLIAKWNDMAKPFADSKVILSLPDEKMGDEHRLSVVIATISKPSYGWSMENVSSDDGFKHRLDLCKTRSKFPDYIKKPDAAGYFCDINWSNLLRIIAANGSCVERVYLISNQIKSDIFPTAADYPQHMRALVHAVWENSEGYNLTPPPLVLWASDKKIEAINELEGDSTKNYIKNLELKTVQNAVSNAINHARKDGFPSHRIGVDVTSGTSLASVGLAIAAFNRGIRMVNVLSGENDSYVLRECELDAGLFVEELNA